MAWRKIGDVNGKIGDFNGKIGDFNAHFGIFILVNQASPTSEQSLLN